MIKHENATYQSFTKKIASLACLTLLVLGSALGQDFSEVPGVVIDHLPGANRDYVGSPSIVILPDGKYIASHDVFGGGPLPEHTHVFESGDRGKSWQKVAELDSLFWPTLFIDNGALYLFGATREYGRMSVRRSDDGGHTWTPTERGILLEEDGFHCASVPVQVFKGRLWKGMERNVPATSWGNFQSFVASAPVGADLLDPKSWSFTPRLTYDRAQWKPGSTWLEGNVVIDPEGQLWNILRVNPGDDRAAMYRVGDDGKTADSTSVKFIELPGAAKKFNIRFDPETKLYYTFTNYALPENQEKHRGARNSQVLLSSPNLTDWTIRGLVLYHPDVEKHAFQYLDWQFDGNDIVIASRTAYADGLGGAHRAHDANLLTFHRLKKFRKYRTPKTWRPLMAGIEGFAVLK